MLPAMYSCMQTLGYFVRMLPSNKRWKEFHDDAEAFLTKWLDWVEENQ